MMYELRQASDADFQFLYELHEATMRDYVQATWGWDDQFQLIHFRKGFQPERLSIVIVDGVDSGAITVEPRPADLYIGAIELHPRVQRRGIGAALVRRALAEAEARHVPALLRVLKVNVGARRLYQRLGFVVVGETETHYDMRCP
jgi:ribosomal protein S18 acetylase RimI-like enzyme